MSATATRARSRSQAPPARPIPGPAGHPLLGMARELRGDLLGTLREGFARHGDVVAYRVGPARGPRRAQRLVVALHHPDDVRRVFTDIESFTRDTPTYRTLRELFGMNLVTADGEDWRRQKRLLQPLLTRAAVQPYATLVDEEARTVVERIGSEGKCTFDGLRTSERYALRVLGRTLFNDDRGADEDTVAALERLVPVVCRQLHARATQPLRLPLRWPTPRNRRFAETRDALHATIERVLAHQGANQTRREAVNLLSQLRETPGPDGEQPLCEQEIRDQALIFLLAGYTTTASGICATLHLLGQAPELQEHVAAGGEKLARAAVQEGLRLHPPSYVLGRRVGEHGAEAGGFELPPGASVLVSPWITHRHPGFWQDPEQFDPRRFVGEHERPPFAWFPFGGGARTCIGRHLSLLESATLVRALLERFWIESLDECLPMAQLNSMRPSRPVRIRCRPR